jgi:hypothetical protein
LSAGLEAYARQISSGIDFQSAEIFAKLLTANDDAGRHGVLIPSESYSFFPELPIPDVTANATVLFRGFDVVAHHHKDLGWKYYQRYPERRITRLNTQLNDISHGRRLAIFLRSVCRDGVVTYFADASVEGIDQRFDALIDLLFGSDVPSVPGAFIRLPVDSSGFSIDAALADLLQRYDAISARWFDSMRTGDTGIGYTFESLVGVVENNDQGADFRGIELKSKLKHDHRATTGKTNLFQLVPRWATAQRGIERLRMLGQQDEEGRYSCYSQVTTTANNLGLWLQTQLPPEGIRLHKDADQVGEWARERLAARLAEKHSRAVFVTAESRRLASARQYKYVELVYCERPDIQKFIDMVDLRRIVFEFTMTERPPGRVRNHGYPWRLVDQRDLDRLFAMQVKLRG